VTRDRFETLDISEPAPHVMLLRLNRPESANAINTAMAAELLALFGELVEPERDVRCVVLTGAGSVAFCAGGDLKQRAGMSDDDWRAQHVLVERLLRTMLDCPIPVLAAVNGAAYGGGCELVLSADFGYAAEHARFALPETSLGIMPGAGGTQNLPRAAGLRRAKELIFTAARFDAADALRWGIVNDVLPGSALVEHTLRVAETIATNAPLAIRQAKLAMQLGVEVDRRTGLFLEAEAYSRLVPTRDRREGVTAFAERRKPVFEGR
jgi:enoyl-CoA hydratase